MRGKFLKFKLLALYFLIYGTLASYSPFLAVYFEQKGLSYSQFGIIFAVNSLVTVFCQPLWGIVTDKYLNKKLTIIMTLGLSGIFVFDFIYAKGFIVILLAIILFMTFQSPITSVNDAYCYEIIDAQPDIQYGKMRIGGSAGYAVVSLMLGIIIQNTGINSSFYSYFIFAVMGILVLASIRTTGNSIRNKTSFKDIFIVLKDKKFAVLIVSAMIINISLGANGSYLAVLIQKTGGDVSNLGMVWFIIAISELPAFFLGNRIFKRYNVLSIYLFSLVIYSIRYLLDSVLVNYHWILAVQVLQSLTFPLYLMATLQYINSIMPPRARTSAITAFNAMSGGIGGVIGNVGGGYIIQNLSVFYLFKIMSVLCILALVVGVVLKVMDKGASHPTIKC